MTLLLLLLLSYTVFTCHPECSWQCDSPTCPAVCSTSCLPYNCSRCFIDPNTNETVDCKKIAVGCSITCPSDQCETDFCPQCSISCNAGLCQGESNCIILCHELQCGWSCRKPTDCPYPLCQLNCEQPACEVSSDSESLGESHHSLFITLLTTLTFLVLR